MKKIGIIGSTGSVGQQTLEYIREHGGFSVEVLTCNGNIDLLKAQINEFQPKIVGVMDEAKALELKGMNLGVEVLSGLNGLKSVGEIPMDLLVTAVVGNVGLLPTVEAIKHGVDIALANKETIVTAGEIIIPMAKKYGVKILPVDSEHSAIFQSLGSYESKDIEKILLTASGGAFRSYSKEEIESLTFREALKHPNWSMGSKITIDSATMMNKGLEVIEAKWLFDVDLDQIQVVVHPESIIHSMVQFIDGSIISQMGVPDMRYPISFALHYPERVNNRLPRMDFEKYAQLNFSKPDLERFPCLKLAYEASKMGGLYPTILNAANEELVNLYLNEQIGFYDISNFIELSLDKLNGNLPVNLDNILLADKEARNFIMTNMR